MTAPVVPLHLGDLHAYEQTLVWLLAFGPFVVLFVVVFVIRRRDADADAGTDEREPEPDTVDQDEPVNRPTS